MAHSTKFSANKVALYAALQDVQGTAQAIADTNAVIAVNLTYDANITSKDEQINGGNYGRNSVTSITDLFSEVSFDTYVPKLGSFAGKRYAITEAATAKVLTALTSTQTFTLAGITVVAKTSGATAAQVVSEFLNYYNGGLASQPHTTMSGTPSALYNALGIFETPDTIRFIAVTSASDVTDLTVTGANASLVSLTVTQGSAFTGSGLPIAPLMEASNFFQDIATRQGIDEILDAQYALARVKAQEGITNTNQARNALVNAIRVGKQIQALELGSAAENTAVDTVVTDLTALQVVTDTIHTSLTTTSADVGTIYAAMAASAAAEDYTTLVADLKVDTLYTKDLFTKYRTLFSGGLVTGETVTVLGLTYTAIGAVTPATIVAALVAGAVGQVTGTLTANWTLSVSAQNASELIAVKSTAAVEADLVTATPVIVSAVGLLANTIVPPYNYNIAIANANLVTYLSNITALTNSNASVNTAFNSLKVKLIDYFVDSKDMLETLEGIVTSATPETVYSNITAANTTVAAGGFTSASLQPTLYKVTFTNAIASPDTATLHVRKSSPDLVGEQKTFIVRDAVATVDLNIAIGERLMLKFNFHGNQDSIANTAELEYPIVRAKSDIADVTTSSNLRNCSITPTGEGLALNNVCFSKLSATNFDGFEHQRALLGCGDIWRPQDISHEVTLTILEEKAGTNTLDSFNVEDSYGKEFDIYFKQDGTRGNTIEVGMTNCVLKNAKQSTVQNIAAYDLTFTCSGISTLILS